TAAHRDRPVDPEMVEEADPLRGVVGPPHPLDPPAGQPRLAPVERDAGVRGAYPLEQPEPGIDAKCGPVLQARVEPARRLHEDRLTRPAHLVAGDDPVNDRLHGFSPRT